MLEPPLPPDEAARLATLYSLAILDTPAEPRFDCITRFAARLFDVPIALITLVDADRQWFKSRQGLDVSETPRTVSFSAHAILDQDVMVVPDTRLDERFADNPLVTGPLRMRFYAGYPLVAPDGSRLGTFCIVDYQPRQLSEADVEALRALAAWVQQELSGTKLNQALLLLQQSAAQLEDFLDTANDLIQNITPQGNFIYVNQAWRETLGYNDQDLRNLSLWDIVRVDCLSDCKALFERAMAGEDIDNIETVLITKQCYSINVSGSVDCRFKDGKPHALRGIFCNVTEQKRAEAALRTAYAQLEHRVKERTAALEYQASHDPLTDLPNRAFFYTALQQAIHVARRENKPIALLLMDLNRFKDVNDTLGHHKGDLLLQMVSTRLRMTLRESDIIARLGGDEFAVLLPGVSKTEAVILANKVLTALQTPMLLEDISIEVGASIGIVIYPHQGEVVDVLMQHADVAMYTAKQGNTGYAVYAPQHDRNRTHHVTLSAELRYAIEHELMVLHYQPKLDMQTGALIGMEALVRWQHPQRGLILPDQFISTAERTGLIAPLTLWVLRSVLIQCQVWRESGIDLGVAVNLSAHNLRDKRLLEQIQHMLQALRLEPRCLELEITESVIMSDPPRALEVLTGLRDIGVKISIDDFGIGYSSLGYLKKLPVDSIKIDRSFVMNMVDDADSASIVRLIIDLAHNLSLEVTAEGVESAVSWNKLALLKCDSAQGYYIQAPLPSAEISTWLKDVNRDSVKKN